MLPRLPLDEGDCSPCARYRLLLCLHVHFDVLLRLPANYQDDEIIETFLGTKIYQNPENYAVEDIETGLSKLQTAGSTYKYENGIISLVSLNDSFFKTKNLSQREEHAFYNEEIYALLKIDKDTKIKKIGVKKHE